MKLPRDFGAEFAPGMGRAPRVGPWEEAEVSGLSSWSDSDGVSSAYAASLLARKRAMRASALTAAAFTAARRSFSSRARLSAATRAWLSGFHYEGGGRCQCGAGENRVEDLLE